MEFLVHIDLHWPPDADPDELRKIAAAEQQRAGELAAQGTLKRLWRIPGRRSNWGLWEAEDATALHEALSSLPFFPWLEITTHAVGHHPNDPGP